MAASANMEHVLPDGRTVMLTSCQHQFLSAYRVTGNITLAAKTAGVHRSVHFSAMKSSEDYRIAFEDAHAEATDLLEEEARRRAVDGCLQMKFTKTGDPLIDPRKFRDGRVLPGFENDPYYYEHVYSDSLLQRLLAANRPEKFNDKKIQHIHEMRVKIAFQTVNQVLNIICEARTIDEALPKIRDLYAQFESDWSEPERLEPGAPAERE